MLHVPMQSVKKAISLADIPATAVIMIPVEGGRELSARAIYLRKPECLIWKRLDLR